MLGAFYSLARFSESSVVPGAAQMFDDLVSSVDQYHARPRSQYQWYDRKGQNPAEELLEPEVEVPGALAPIWTRVEGLLDVTFARRLTTHLRDGRDYRRWHSDDAPSLDLAAPWPS